MKYLFTLLFSALLVAGCNTTPNKTVEQRRSDVLAMRETATKDIQVYQSNIREKMAKAPGYAVFSNANVNIIFASFAGGYGVVRDNRSGKDIYMKMGEAGLGLGLGAKDFRAAFIFKTERALDDFINKGWLFGAHADAAAKATDKGAAADTATVADDIEIYQLTEAGLALQATVKGTKFWQDDSLN